MLAHSNPPLATPEHGQCTTAAWVIYSTGVIRLQTCRFRHEKQRRIQLQPIVASLHGPDQGDNARVSNAGSP